VADRQIVGTRVSSTRASKVVPYCGRVDGPRPSHEVGPGLQGRQPGLQSTSGSRSWGRLVTFWSGRRPLDADPNVASAVGPESYYVRLHGLTESQTIVMGAEPRESVLPRAPIRSRGAPPPPWRSHRPPVRPPTWPGSHTSGVRTSSRRRRGSSFDGNRVAWPTSVHHPPSTVPGIVHLAPALRVVDREGGRRARVPSHPPPGDAASRLQSRSPPCAGPLFVKEPTPASSDASRAPPAGWRRSSATAPYPPCLGSGTPPHLLLRSPRRSWFARTQAEKAAFSSRTVEIIACTPSTQHGRVGDWLENTLDWAALPRNRDWWTPLPVWRFLLSPPAHDPTARVGSELPLSGRALGRPVIHRPYVDDVPFPCLGGWLRGGLPPALEPVPRRLVRLRLDAGPQFPTIPSP